jgi:predicted nucleic acid-binding protein
VPLTKRVEVLFDPDHYRTIERIARSKGKTVGALVRKAVEQQYLKPSIEERRAAVRDLLDMESDLTWEEAKEIIEKDPGRRFDTNIFIYALGRPHRHKEPCRRLVAQIGDSDSNYYIDVELLQEILHVYDGRGDRAFGLAVFDILAALVPNLLPIGRSEILLSRQILERYPALSPRDAIHAAVVSTHHLEGIVTTDAAFTQVGGLMVYDPISLAVDLSQ